MSMFPIFSLTCVLFTGTYLLLHMDSASSDDDDTLAGLLQVSLGLILSLASLLSSTCEMLWSSLRAIPWSGLASLLYRLILLGKIASIEGVRILADAFTDPTAAFEAVTQATATANGVIQCAATMTYHGLWLFFGAVKTIVITLAILRHTVAAVLGENVALAVHFAVYLTLFVLTFFFLTAMTRAVAWVMWIFRIVTAMPRYLVRVAFQSS